MRIALVAVLLGAVGLVSAGDDDWVDAHLHYVDFMQQSDGSGAMLAAMDKAGVEEAWLFGLPVVKKWQQDA
ncbi:MAG: amidohydrolase, partial [Pseudomonadota bacterium]|nr:amidohydrolase [Pseudomonadota bacterium]